VPDAARTTSPADVAEVDRLLDVRTTVCSSRSRSFTFEHRMIHAGIGLP
jgi:hypothetical protein